MGSLFGKPKIPKQTPPEPPPSPITVNEDVVTRQGLDRIRRKRGRASTLLNNGAPASVGLKTVTGA
jgi:hypothetical protein